MTVLAPLLVLAMAPVAAGLIGGRVATRAARRLPPAAATVALTGFALTVSFATLALLCLTAFLGVVERFPATHPSDWSTPTLRERLPVPIPVGLAAGGVAAALLGRAARHLGRAVATARRTAAVVATWPSVGELTIVDDNAAHAYSVPGRNRRVVVSTGLLRSLTGPQRRALLAHEQAHLRHHHHRYAQLARLAAAAHPTLSPVARAVDRAIERWADAVAVRAVGDPVTVAHALGVAALAAPPPAGGLGAAHHDVVDRVRDLLEPPRRRSRAAVPLALAALLCWASVIALALYTFSVVELSESTLG
ncbi:M56 family metallopeptidase [Pseudofrankia asymbiotica]|uniref:Peptidase M48 n=1 Tax=Pseudofrankia asymbiotica TaxID=1834516 RepID=A0A1V2HZJ5_9ACTN|nr:M56 family metallopeptidase [Pseudofrankia asymbiotica]ONH21993.1 peptidase M48 [Pseudofrankia asymbiotica]